METFHTNNVFTGPTTLQATLRLLQSELQHVKAEHLLHRECATVLRSVQSFADRLDALSDEAKTASAPAPAPAPAAAAAQDNNDDNDEFELVDRPATASVPQHVDDESENALVHSLSSSSSSVTSTTKLERPNGAACGFGVRHLVTPEENAHYRIAWDKEHARNKDAFMAYFAEPEHAQERTSRECYAFFDGELYKKGKKYKDVFRRGVGFVGVPAVALLPPEQQPKVMMLAAPSFSDMPAESDVI
jgi:hypothetical protein